MKSEQKKRAMKIFIDGALLKIVFVYYKNVKYILSLLTVTKILWILIIKSKKLLPLKSRDIFFSLSLIKKLKIVG